MSNATATEKENRREGWNSIPHWVVDDYIDGRLSFPQFRVLVWLFCIADPYGYAHITFDAIVDDVFRGKADKSWATRLICELKSKQYIWYPRRTGKRGSFKVLLEGFLRKDGSFVDIAAKKTGGSVRGSNRGQPLQSAAPNTQQAIRNQSFEQLEYPTNEGEEENNTPRQVRGHQNENENDITNRDEKKFKERPGHQRQMDILLQEMGSGQNKTP